MTLPSWEYAASVAASLESESGNFRHRRIGNVERDASGLALCWRDEMKTGENSVWFLCEKFTGRHSSLRGTGLQTYVGNTGLVACVASHQKPACDNRRTIRP
jgi:hypothetical protein